MTKNRLEANLNIHWLPFCTPRIFQWPGTTLPYPRQRMRITAHSLKSGVEARTLSTTFISLFQKLRPFQTHITCSYQEVALSSFSSTWSRSHSLLHAISCRSVFTWLAVSLQEFCISLAGTCRWEQLFNVCYSFKELCIYSTESSNDEGKNIIFNTTFTAHFQDEALKLHLQSAAKQIKTYI